MSEKRSLEVLFSFLGSEGWLDADARQRAEKLLLAPSGVTHWSIQLLTGAGAWLAATMLLGFTCFVLNLRDPEAYIALGLVLVGGATAIRAVATSPFVEQLALAFSVAGQMLAVGGAGYLTRHTAGAFTMAALLCVILQVVYRDPVHRGLTWAGTLALGTFWLGQQWLSLLHVAVAVMALGVTVWATADRPAAALRPFAYVCAAGLPVLLFIMCFAFGPVTSQVHSSGEQLPDVPSRVLLAVLLWQLVGWAARGLTIAPEPLVLARIAIALLACVGSAGLLAAALLLVIGFERQDRILLALGALALPLFLWAFYYDLRLTLAVKSLALVASGATLLAGRMVLIARPWAQGGSR